MKNVVFWDVARRNILEVGILHSDSNCNGSGIFLPAMLVAVGVSVVFIDFICTATFLISSLPDETEDSTDSRHQNKWKAVSLLWLQK
jgi:hypothetical protein